MTADQLQTLKANLEAVEGRVNHMYLDTGSPPWVTCGVGHRIATLGDALQIPFEPAWQIAEDFRCVSAAPRGFKASAYVGYSKSRLPDAAIDALLDADIAERIEDIRRRRWPQFDSWPEPCQLAVADLVFNLGLAGLERKFPHCTAAIDREDWNTAAEESNRPQLSKERNEQTKALLLKGARLSS